MISGSDGLCGKQILKLKNVSSRGGKIGGLAPAVSRLCRCRRGAVEFLKCDVYFFLPVAACSCQSFWFILWRGCSPVLDFLSIGQMVPRI